MNYFFILGRNPTLSIAEIISQMDTRIKPNFSRISNEVLILETKEEIDCQKLQERLGGTIKIGEMISQINTNVVTNNTNIRIIRDRISLISEHLKKVYFGFSLYQLDEKINLRSFKPQIKELALKIKKELQEKGISSRWVESKERFLSSVIVQKNKLLTQGVEFVFLISQKESWLGKTIGCQEFEEYEFYDFARPKRKIEQGMMPPKLAKIMINLARVPESGTILDPFCGSGTIIQEAARLGYRHLIGTDITKKAVDNTKANLKWLTENFQFSISNFQINHNVQIFQTDVKEISKKLPANSVDAIVTEPYLGPIKIKNIEYRIKNIEVELSSLYLAAFQEFRKVLKPAGKIVMIFPVFRTGNKLHFLLILDELKKSGWQIINPIPPELRKSTIIKITPRNSIIYSRPDQKVLREILIFETPNLQIHSNDLKTSFAVRRLA